MKSFQVLALVALCLLVVTSQTFAAPVTLNYKAITKHNEANVLTGEMQFATEVSQSGSLVVFKFMNTGTTGSVITDIYFDDGSLLGISAVQNGPGTNFSILANPSELPDAGLITPTFQTSQAFSIGSNNPEKNKGIREGRWMSVLFNLQAGRTYQDVLDELGSGELRIGVYGQDIGSTVLSNESFVNVSLVPEPATIAIMVMGLTGLPMASKRRG